jgi:head-tail adaptor
MARPTTIADLRHRIVLCTMHDVMAHGGTMELTRTAAAKCWAGIRPFRSRAVFMSPVGFAIMDPGLHQDHVVTIRKQVDVDVTSAAWIYEERRKSPPRWYKVLGWAERGNWGELSCHLHEKSDSAQPPVSDLLQPVASKVVL